MFKYLSIAAAAALTMAGASAQAEVIKVKLEPVVSGVNAPLAMVQPAGDSRMFVIEQWRRVMIVEDVGGSTSVPDREVNPALSHPTIDACAVHRLSIELRIR